MSHIHEKIDFTVEVFIIHKNTVLLRKHDKYKIWLSVGGHIELDEDPNKTAIREVKEEVGLNITLADDLRPFEKKTPEYEELIPPKFLNCHKINETHEHICLVYFATSSTDVITPSESEKTEEWKWFTRKELGDASFGIQPNITHYATRALQELGEKH